LDVFSSNRKNNNREKGGMNEESRLGSRDDFGLNDQQNSEGVVDYWTSVVEDVGGRKARILFETRAGWI
jgi:hypothetical protein